MRYQYSSRSQLTVCFLKRAFLLTILCLCTALALHLSGAAPTCADNYSESLTVTVSMPGNTDNMTLTTPVHWVLASEKELESVDGKIRLRFSPNTEVDLKGQKAITVAAEPDPPSVSDNCTTVCAYNLTPNGATFSPAVLISLNYDVYSLPAGASESSLFIAWWTGASWQKTASSVNPLGKTVSAQITHFSIFAVRCPTPAAPAPAPPSPAPGPAPSPWSIPSPSVTPAATTNTAGQSDKSKSAASFIFSDLSVSPTVAGPGEPVEITVRAVNGGSSEGSRSVALLINGKNAAQSDIALPAGKSQVLSFTVRESDPGDYAVKIEGQSGSFKIHTLATMPSPPGELSLPVIAVIAAGGLMAIIVALTLIFKKKQRRA